MFLLRSGVMLWLGTMPYHYTYFVCISCCQATKPAHLAVLNGPPRAPYASLHTNSNSAIVNWQKRVPGTDRTCMKIHLIISFGVVKTDTRKHSKIRSEYDFQDQPQSNRIIINHTIFFINVVHSSHKRFEVEWGTYPIYFMTNIYPHPNTKMDANMVT